MIRPTVFTRWGFEVSIKFQLYTPNCWNSFDLSGGLEWRRHSGFVLTKQSTISHNPTSPPTPHLPATCYQIWLALTKHNMMKIYILNRLHV